MRIFRLPASLLAHLNAKRFPWQCFRYQLMISNSSVFHPCPPSLRRPALLPATHPAPLASFRFSSRPRPVSSRPRPARLLAFLPVQLLPVFLAVRSSRSRYLRPVCRVVGRGVVRSNPSRSAASDAPCQYPSRSFGVPSSPRLSCRGTRRQAGRASFAHAVCAFVRFPCSKGNLYIFLWKIA